MNLSNYTKTGLTASWNFISHLRRSPGLAISPNAQWWETNAMGSPRWHALHARACLHRVCVYKAMGAPRIQFSAWFVRPSLPRGTLGAYFAPLGSHWQLSPTKQILSFRFLRPTRESLRRRGKEMGLLRRIRKIDELVKNHDTIVRYRICNFF